MSPQINALRSKHEHFELDLKAELAHPLPDDQRIIALKKAKLRIKDKIARLARASAPQSPPG